MMTVKKKKRIMLKKLVKVIGFFLIFFVIFLIVVYFLDDSYAFSSDNNYFIDMEDSELNRVTYVEGFYYEKLSKDLKERITGGSFPLKFKRNFTPVVYDELRYVKVKYYDFDGVLHDDGEIIVHKLVAQDIVEIFNLLYLEKYSIASIKLVEEFDSSDELSMEANNTSAFNYRIVENIDRLSWHAYGLAIDINPLYNPYLANGRIYPSTALDYADRSLDFDGKIDHNDLAYKIFTKYGWKWGGDFKYVKDYQHFYKEVFDDDIRERKD